MPTSPHLHALAAQRRDACRALASPSAEATAARRRVLHLSALILGPHGDLTRRALLCRPAPDSRAEA